MNPYKELSGEENLHRSSTDDEVRLAFRAIAWALHPDRCVLKGERLQAQCADAFAMASLANSKIRTEADRVAFEKSLGPTYTSCQPCKGAGATFRQKSIRVRVATTCGACEGLGRVQRSRA